MELQSVANLIFWNRMLKISGATKIKERIAREEWDFSKLPDEEAKACCFFEYGRESAYIVEKLENPPGPYDEIDEQREQLRNSQLLFGLPPRAVGSKVFHEPWLCKEQWWRKWFCKDFEEHFNGLNHARILEKTPDHAFHEKLAPHFPWRKWEKDMTRLLDRKTGLEAVLVTIDWGDFDDREILDQVKKWIRTNRPPGIGVHSNKGKKTISWRKNLEKLAILRLRHHYSLEEIASVRPLEWTANKFFDRSEMNRACKGARDTLHQLFPFLAKKTLPLSWSPLQNPEA